MDSHKEAELSKGSCVDIHATTPVKGVVPYDFM